jgi:hypothetical protein
VGYRWLDMDHQLRENVMLFRYDVLLKGPVLAFVFRF